MLKRWRRWVMLTRWRRCQHNADTIVAMATMRTMDSHIQDYKDKDNPHTDDDPPLSTKANLDGCSTNDNLGSRDINTPNPTASSNSKASRFSPISVTMAPLNELTGEVMNTTMDENSFGTLLMDDPGDVDLHAGLWWTDVDCAMRSYVHDCGG